MGCGCGKDKPKGEGKSFTKAVIEINNREKITLLRKVVIPTSLGDETTIPPAVGEYRNVILVYEASKRVYIYSSDGIPTLVAIDPLFIESELERLGIEIEEEKAVREDADEELSDEIESVASDLATETAARIQADNGLQGSINTHTTQITSLSTQINTETTNRQNADIDLQNQIDAISAASDVKDIVGTYQELQNYDTSGLGNNDIIKVLRDETQDGATTYYRWNAANQTFSLIGEEGPYYTKSETDSLLTGKQDMLEAGENISIIGNTISATDTTYTAGSGLDLTGTEFSVDTSTIQEKLAAGNNISINGNTISATDTTYTAGSGLDLTGTEFSIDSTVALKTDLPTVNNATLTVQKNGTDVATFTANSASDVTANITVPTDTAQLTNAAGYQTASDVQNLISGKQNTLTPGTNIQISNDVISATDTTYSAGNGLNLTGTTFSADTDILQTKLTPGSNIQISNGVISSDGPTYSAGTGLDLTGNVFSIDNTVALKSDIPTISTATLTIQRNGTDVATFTTNDPNPVTANILVPTNNAQLTNGAGYQTASDVQSLITGKQDVLTPGNNIQINGNTISATDTKYSAGSGLNLTGTVFTADTDVLQSKLTAGNNITISSGTISATDTTYSDFTGADASTAGTHGLVPAPIAGDQNKFLRGDGTWANDNTELVEMAYGESNAWAKFIAAYTDKKIVYCRASSNSNPGSGAKTRKAFMAYVNDETNPTSVEFQYVRSINSKSNSQQCDQVFVYTLTSTKGGTWSVATRNMATTVNVDSSLTKTYTGGANATMTLKANAMTGATSSVAGTAGYVPAPAAGDNTKYLSGDGTWKTISQYALPIATANDLGGIKVGNNLSIDSTTGVLDAVVPTVNNATLTIQKNGTSVGTFTANASSNKSINITVPTSAADVSALPASTKYGASIAVSINTTDYKVTTTLKDQDGNTLGTAQVIDLPLESVVVNGSYDSTNKKIVLTLQSGSTIDIPVGDLVAGLQSEITSTNKLSSDLVDDTSHTHKFVTAAQITKLNGIAAGAEVNVQSDWDQTTTTADDYIKNKPSIPTKTSDLTNDSNFVSDANYVHTDNNYTTTEKNKLSGIAAGAEVNVQANWAQTTTTADDYIKNKPTLATVATSGSYNDLSNKPTIPAAQVNSDWNATSGVARILNKPTIPTATSDLTNDSGFITSTVNNLVNYTPTTGLAEVATSGSYNDLEDKPTIPATQVNSDWDSDSGVSQILNKPTLATVATSGSYNDLSNKPTIPAAQVNSDWNASSGVARILNKPTLATVATSGSYNDLSNKPTIPTVPTKVSAFTNDAGYQNSTQVQSAINSAISGITGFEYQVVQTLPATGEKGVIYLVPNSGSAPNIYDEYIWIESGQSGSFEKIGTTETDLSGYVTDGELQTALADYTTTEDLATVATSGSYNDLSNKPTIPAAQVNSDWNASSGVAKILNKPTLATVATSGSYNDLSNKPTIPTVNNATLTIQKNGTTVKTFTANASSNVTANITVPTKTSDITNDSNFVASGDLATVATSGSYNDLSNKPTIPAAQVQSNWTQTTTTAVDYIKNKPTLAAVATSGSYNDLSNKPTIPTVNNATLTIQHNEETVQTFTANASSNKTANINATKRFKIADSTADFSRWVIALCRVSTTNNTALNSYSIGTLSFHRDNGLSGAGEIEIAIDNRYSTAYVTNVSYASNFPLLPQNADLDTAAGWRPCTFKYNDVWYGGIEVMIGTAVYGYMEFNGATNENVFGVKYYTTYKPNSSTPAVIENQEIYDSLMYDKWVHERGKFYFDSVDVQSGTISKGSGQYTATLPNKTGTIAMTSDAQKFAIGQGSTNPVFDDMTPIRTFEWDVSDANYRPIYTIANTGLTYINLDVTVAYRITITGTNINGVVDVVDRWHNPASYPITSMFCRTLSTAAATTGLRYLRAVYPTSSYVNKASYPLGQEIAMYNTTARHVKVEVFKDNSQVTWNTTKPSGSIYVNSTYNGNSVMNAYDTRGWRFRQPVQMQASGASYASYISDYEPVTVGVNDLKSSGTALTAGHMAFLAEDGKVYDISNTTQSIAMGPSKIGYMNSNVNANTVISSTYWRAITRLGATQFGYFRHDTVALGDRLFLRCTMDSNGKIHSGNYLAKSMSAGYTWMPFGYARSATTAYVDTRHPIFYTINSNGKLTHINGIQVAGSSTIASYSSGTLYLTNPT